MKKLILSLLCLLVISPLFAEAAQKIYKVNIKNFRENEMSLKEVAIANDRLYFFSQEINTLYCYGATDKQQIWRLTLDSLLQYRRYNSICADSMGRCIILAPQPKGVNVIEISNLGKIAAEHKFPEINPKSGKFLLLNGSILFNGKEVGVLKTKLVFLKEERNRIAEASMKAGKLKELSKQEFLLPVIVEGAGVKKQEFSVTLKYNEPTTIMKALPIRIDNYGRAYFHIVTARDYREDEDEKGAEQEFKNIVMLTDLKGKVLHTMEPVNAVSSMVTVDDNGKICEVYRVKDPDRKKAYMYRVYYWYVKYTGK